jgi:serine/threonine protein kinase
MSQCLNPNCLYQNPENARFCQRCGNQLHLFRRYRAIQILGQGGFGKTFLAVDEGKPSQPNCVIKQFYPQAQRTDRIEKAAELFAREAEQLDELGEHPQIPDLLAYFTEGGYQYLVQEYIDGQDLEKILTSQGKFSEKQIRDVLQQILPILQYLHERNVIHRDIKPENLIRRGDGKLMLVDFGAAKQVTNATFSVTGTTIGSAGYVSPEQAVGKAKPNSDLYSLGATCVRLLTQVRQTHLYDVITHQTWQNFLDTPIEKQLGDILDKMLVVAVKKRYQSAGEVLQDLQPAKAPSSSSPPSKPKLPSTSPSIATSGSQVELRSAVGYDYTRLQDLLANHKWREADEETTKAMLEVAGREKRGFFELKDIENFPCEDLRTIDRLWVIYSNGKFGFSVQKQIYQKLGGTRKFDLEKWKKFGDTVGWREKGNWKSSSQLQWEGGRHTPVGHLPLASPVDLRWLGAPGVTPLALFARAETCKL